MIQEAHRNMALGAVMGGRITVSSIITTREVDSTGKQFTAVRILDKGAPVYNSQPGCSSQLHPITVDPVSAAHRTAGGSDFSLRLFFVVRTQQSSGQTWVPRVAVACNNHILHAICRYCE